jgi:hypothetical protein
MKFMSATALVGCAFLVCGASPALGAGHSSCRQTVSARCARLAVDQEIGANEAACLRTSSTRFYCKWGYVLDSHLGPAGVATATHYRSGWHVTWHYTCGTTKTPRLHLKQRSDDFSPVKAIMEDGPWRVPRGSTRRATSPWRLRWTDTCKLSSFFKPAGSSISVRWFGLGH